MSLLLFVTAEALPEGSTVSELKEQYHAPGRGFKRIRSMRGKKGFTSKDGTERQNAAPEANENRNRAALRPIKTHLRQMAAEVHGACTCTQVKLE